MTSEIQPSVAGTAIAALAERGRATPHEPWLFHRDGWDWRWRSWSRVADQVARGAAVLRDAVAGGTRVGFRARQHPDAVAAGLAIQAAGRVAVPVPVDRHLAAEVGCGAWAEVGDEASAEPGGLAGVALPAALSPLDQTSRRPLDLDADSAAGAVHLPERGELEPRASMAAAGRLEGEGLAGELLPARGRAIVCASPALDLPSALVLESWTLLRDAAWVLEPDPATFLATVLWARPTLVWGLAGELELLAERLRTRKHRRHSRLSAIVVAGGGELDPEPWSELGVEVTGLGSDPLAVRPPVGRVGRV